MKILDLQNRVAILFENTDRIQILFMDYTYGTVLKMVDQISRGHSTFGNHFSYLDKADGCTYHVYTCEKYPITNTVNSNDMTPFITI